LDQEGADTSREDADAPSARSASIEGAGVSGNEIARRLGVAPSTVRLTLQRLAAAGLAWPLPVAMTDTVLEAQLFTAVGTK
jgi:transposase